MRRFQNTFAECTKSVGGALYGLLVFQNDGSGKGRGLVVLGPRRADSTSEDCDLALELACCFPECLLSPFIEFSLCNCRDGNFQSFTSLPDGVAKEFAFRSVNQRVRSENFRERRQRAT